MRGKTPANRLLFDPKIEKIARRNNSRRRKKQLLARRNQQEGEPSTPHSWEDPPQPKLKVMAGNNNNNRRTLGDYATQQGPRNLSSIVMPPFTNNRAVEMKPAFLSLISSNQFVGLDHEDPYTHLSTFYELCSTMGVSTEEEEAVYLRLFPFSLTGKAKTWLQSHPNQSLTDWSDVESKFLARFFPLSRYVSAKSAIATFSQGADESLCEAWER